MTLAFSPDSIVLDTRHLIGGVRHADILRLPVIRPSDGETAAELPLADAALVDQAVQPPIGHCKPRLGARYPAGPHPPPCIAGPTSSRPVPTSSRVWRP